MQKSKLSQKLSHIEDMLAIVEDCMEVIATNHGIVAKIRREIDLANADLEELLVQTRKKVTKSALLSSESSNSELCDD